MYFDERYFFNCAVKFYFYLFNYMPKSGKGHQKTQFHDYVIFLYIYVAAATHRFFIILVWNLVSPIDDAVLGGIVSCTLFFIVLSIVPKDFSDYLR